MNLDTQILFGTKGDLFDRHQGLAIAGIVLTMCIGGALIKVFL